MDTNFSPCDYSSALAFGGPTACAADYALTVFRSTDLLTKVLSLDAAGAPVSDSSRCCMTTGAAQRRTVRGAGGLAALLGGLAQNEALALGTLRDGLPDTVAIVTKAAVAASVSGTAGPATITRSKEHIVYAAGRPAFVLLDIDCKAMPAATAARIAAGGGYETVLATVLPELRGCGRVVRASTSSGLYRPDGSAVAGSNGLHILVAVADGGDAERFLSALHDRCWLAGYGWYMAGAAGQLLERSLIDRAVAAPERLVFEAAPVLTAPLLQDAEARRPRAYEGPPLDTRTACPNVTDTAGLGRLKAAAREAIAPQARLVRAAFVQQHGGLLAARTGLSAAVAAAVIERQCDGVLRPDIALPWDDAALTGKTVGDVLREPETFIGETLADPLEGPAYGPQKAKVLARAEGGLFINSFAHGGVKYELKYDAKAVRALIEATDKTEVGRLFVKLVALADLDALERDALLTLTANKSGVTRKVLKDLSTAGAAGGPATGDGEARDPVIKAMNAKYMVVNDDGRAMVYKPMDDAILNRRFYQRIKFEDLERLHMNEVAWVNNKAISVARLWLQHPERKQYIGGIVFDPSGLRANADELNLWQGFAVEPRPGCWDRMKAHIYHVICQAKEADYNYVMNWLARLVQFPAMVGEVAIVMRGDEGVGKGLLARSLRHVFGQHGMHITNAKHLVGNFNLHLRDTVMLFADEAFFAGDKAHTGILNGLITEPMLTIEGKGRDTVHSSNYLHIMMASNSDWVVPAAIGARRFMVLDVLSTYKNNRAYFRDIAQEMEHGGYEAMLHELLHRDLSGFDVRAVIDTAALQEQKKLSLPTAEAWWLDVLLRGYVWKSRLHLPYFGEWQEKVTTELLYQSYADYARDCRERHPLTRESFGRFMQRMGGMAGRWRNGVIGEKGAGPLAGTHTQERATGYHFGKLKLSRNYFSKTTGLTVDWEPVSQVPDQGD